MVHEVESLIMRPDFSIGRTPDTCYAIYIRVYGLLV